MLDPLSAPLGSPLAAPIPPAPAPAPPAPWAAEMTRVEPLEGSGFMGLQDAQNGAPPSAPDPEATQAWALPLDEEDEPSTPSVPSASSGGQGAGPFEQPPPVPSWAGGEPASSGGPIVPDSWFAEPRPPSAEPVAEQTRQLTPETPGADAGWGPAQPALPPGPPNGLADGGFGAPPADAPWQPQPVAPQDGAYGGHAGQDAGHPGQDGQGAGYAAQHAAYPGQDAGYAGQHAGYPGQDEGYAGPAGYAGAEGHPGPNGHPQPGGPYPGQENAYHPNGGYPGPEGGYPGPNGGYPGPDGGYGGPEGGYGQEHPRPAGRSNKSLAIVVGVLVTVAAVAVGIVMWPDEGGKTAVGATSSATPRNASEKTPVKKPKVSAATRQQAQAVHELLDASAHTRNQLAGALAAAGKCKTLPAGIAGFQRVAQRRTVQINRTNRLKVDKLRNGVRLQNALRQAFQLSLQTDQAFLAWAQGAQGCKGRPAQDADYARGNSLSAQATVAKRRFSALWNPIAQDVGLPPRTDRQF